MWELVYRRSESVTKSDKNLPKNDKRVLGRGVGRYNTRKTERGRMTEKAARTMADRLADMGQIKEEDAEFYALGIEVILSSGVTAAAVLILGALLRNWEGAAAFLLCFMHIRNYSGGYHASTRGRCFLTSVSCYVCSWAMARYVSVQTGELQMAIALTGFLASIWIFYRKAPVENKNKRLPKDWKQRNRSRTFWSLGLWAAIAGACAVIDVQLSEQIIAVILIIAVLLLKVRREDHEEV